MHAIDRFLGSTCALVATTFAAPGALAQQTTLGLVSAFAENGRGPPAEVLLFMSVPLLALVFLVRAVATWLPALIG